MPSSSLLSRRVLLPLLLLFALLAGLATSAFAANTGSPPAVDGSVNASGPFRPPLPQGEPLPTPVVQEPVLPDDHELYDEELSRRTENEPRFRLPVGANMPASPNNAGGQWGPVITWPHTPVSMANLPDGRILTWSGSEREHWPTTEQTYSATWNPTTGTFEEFFYEGHNMFCADLVALEDGRILALGGRNTVDMTSIFDFSTNTWTPVEPMNTRRWYPTSVVLGNGDVFTAVGRGGRYPERYTVGEGWTLLTGADLQGPILDYGVNKDGAGWLPLMHLDPRGNVFHYGATPQMHEIDPTGAGSVTPLGPNNFSWFPEESVAIMYDEGKILVAGGAIDSGTNTSSSQAATIDINGATPVVTNISPMHFARQFANEVILPNGQVLVIGGNTSGTKFSDSGTVLEAEIWDPNTQTWTLTNPMSVPRNYHSTAILLPDGRVLAAGGGYAAGNPDHPATHTNGQVFSPPYLFNADGTPAPRPAINAAPTGIASGETFTVQASGNVVTFAMVRMSSTTHTTNTGQMRLELPFSGSGGVYQLTAHSNPNVLVPGYWMLFALDDSGVPSTSHIIQVNSSGKPWVIKPADQSDPAGLPASFDLQAGDTSGETLSFAASGLPNGLSINPNSGRISGTPNTAGTFNVTATVSDPAGNSRATSFAWTIFPQGQGQILHEWWLGIGGTSIASLTGHPNFPDSPSGAAVLSSFEAPINWTDNYGARIRGLLIPPTSGSYRFWIASDDNGELWLSGNDNPAGAVRIAHVPSWSASRQWTKFPEQQSALVNLVAGEPYFIEALMKEGGGGDNLAVAWQMPGQSGPTVIDGAYLSTYVEAPPEPLSLDPLTAAPQLVNSQISYTAAAQGGSGTVRYKWSFGDGSGETPYSTSPTVNHTFSAPGRYLVTLTALDDAGVTVSTQVVQAIHRPATANRPAASGTLAYAAGSSRIWNVNPDNNSVSVFNALSGAKLAEIPVGVDPQTLAIAPNGRVWVANRDSASLTIIDQSSLTVLNTLNLPRGSQPYGLAFSPTGDAAYLALEQTGQLLKLDPAGGSVLASLAVGPNPRHVTVAADGATVYVSRFITPLLPGEETAVVQTTGVGGEILVVDGPSMTAAGTILLQVDAGSDFEAGARGVPNYLGALAISPDGLSGWVPSKEDNILRGQLRDGLDLNFEHTVRAISSYVDLTTGQEDFVFRIDHDNSSLGSAAAFGPTGSYLFVALETSREVAVVDAYSRAELFRIETGLAPQGLAVSPDGSRLFVHNFMDRTIGVYDLSILMSGTGETVTQLAVLDTVAAELLDSQILTGKQLFYDAADPRLALDGYMSCASCHNGGGQDGRVWDFTGFGEGLRNTISLEGRGGPDHGPLHWTANFNEIHDFEGQIRAFADGTGLMNDPDFNATSDPLGVDKAGLSADLDALAAYVNSLTTFGDSPYRNGDGSLTAQGSAGRAVFETSGCASCHGGGAFTDSAEGQLHDVGTIRPSSGGRIGGPLTGLDTPTLRGLWATAPYLHDGSAATLTEAILAHDGVNLGSQDLAALHAYLYQIDDAEPAPPPPPAAGGPKLAYGLLTNVGDGWQTVTLPQSYDEMVVIATAQIEISGLPAITRVRNAAGSSFEVRVQNPSGSPLSGVSVHYFVAEAGVYTAAADGITMEAVTYTSTVTDHDSSWGGESRAYGQSYTNPVVLGQVMTANDPAWSVFWGRGSSQFNPPDGSSLWLGKHVGEDPNITRAAETVGYMVFESGTVQLGDLRLEAALGSDTITGFNTFNTYAHGLGELPAAVVLSAAGMDGGNGGWPVLYGLDRITGSLFGLIFDEDQVGDSERAHITEQVAYVAVVAGAEPPPPPPPGAGPRLHYGVVSGVGSSWQTVTLPQSYDSMVVVATPQYASGQLPAVTRVRNANGSSFELQVQNPSGAPLSGYTVHYIVVEAGVYSAAEHGIAMEAVTFSAGQTDRKGSWSAESRAYGRNFANPVVLGQVMSANDAGWSVFWARGGSATSVPDSASLFVGKHVGEDTAAGRAPETIGYIVVEAGSGTVNGLSFEAGVGSDIVAGVNNAPPYSYPLAQTGQAAVLSASGMDGGDGGWPILYGSNPLGGGALALAFDEDQIRDSERSHTTEQVAYFVIH